jgi:hypothetical protein
MYTYEGVTYPGVTGILKILDKSGPLMGWAARQTAEAFIANIDKLDGLLGSVGPEGVIRAMTARSAWKNDEAKDMGSRIHELADLINTGKETGPMTPTEAVRVQHYVDWMKKCGWDIKVSEAYLVNPDHGFGGTLDILARDADVAVVLADIKSGKTVADSRTGRIYKDIVLQLAAYGFPGNLIQPQGATAVSKMPKPDRYVIVHVTPTGVREIEVHVGDEERAAFLACMDLTRWSDSQKGRAL